MLWLGGIVKINKMSQSLVLIPLTGMVSLMGTLPAMATECSALSPCAPAVSSLSDTLDSPNVQVTVPLVPSVTDSIAPTVDSVSSSVTTELASPVAGTINKVTAPAVDAIDNTATPITTVVQEPVVTVTQPESPDDTDFVSPQDTKSVGMMPAVASETTTSAQLYESAAATAGALSILNLQPASIHSAQGSMIKVRDSGGFGFGHLNPADDPVAFSGLAFAYIIVLGSAIGFAVKRSAFLHLRGFA